MTFANNFFEPSFEAKKLTCSKQKALICLLCEEVPVREIFVDNPQLWQPLNNMPQGSVNYTEYNIDRRIRSDSDYMSSDAAKFGGEGLKATKLRLIRESGLYSTGGDRFAPLVVVDVRVYGHPIEADASSDAQNDCTGVVMCPLVPMSD